MKVSQMLKMVDAAGLSPEDFGARLGVSGMTIRRWMKSKKGNLPKIYQVALRQTCLDLVAEGRLKSNHPLVIRMLHDSTTEYHQSACRHLGLRAGSAVFRVDAPEEFLPSLFEIGAQASRQEEVVSRSAELDGFRRMGHEWAERIDLLWRALRSDKISNADKLVSFGALFYLITPFDFIPDQLPVFGFMDDFIVLGLAVAFYKKRFGNIFSK